MKSSFCLPALLLALPLAALAQTHSVPDSLRQRGELTGSRPSTRSAPMSRATPAARSRAAAADPVVSTFLNETVDLAHVRAEELPDLYEHFIVKCRAERRQWKYADWDRAADVLARLNQRYEQVRTELPIEERLRIRSFQGEFHTLRGARKVSDKLE